MHPARKVSRLSRKVTYTGHFSYVPRDKLFTSDAFAGLRSGLQCAHKFNVDEDAAGLQKHQLNNDGLEEVSEHVRTDQVGEENEMLGCILVRKPFIFRKPAPSANADALHRLSTTLGPNAYILVFEDPQGNWQSEGSTDKPFYDAALRRILRESGKEPSDPPVALYRDENGAIALYAERDLEEGMPFAMETGALWSKSAYERMANKEPDKMIGLFATDVPAKYFHPLGYTGGDLVYDCSTHGNECRFIHDATWHCLGDSVSSNSGPFVVITKKEPYVHIIHFTTGSNRELNPAVSRVPSHFMILMTFPTRTEPVKAGEELRVDYGDNTWDRILKMQLAGQTRMSRGWYFRLEVLKKILSDIGLPGPTLRPRLGYAQLNRIFFFDSAKETLVGSSGQAGHGALTGALLDDPTETILRSIQYDESVLLPRQPKKAKSSGFDTATLPSDIQFSDELRKVVAKIGTAFDACYETASDRTHWSGQFGHQLRAIADGTADRFIEVARVTDPVSVVKLFTPLTCVPLAAIAKHNISQGNPFSQYVGFVTTADDGNCSLTNAYLYDLSKSELAKRGYHGESDILINAETSGNESRFINDCWSPKGLTPRKPNCEVVLIFDGKDKLPRLFYFATRNIKSGEEIIVDYGPNYWKITFRTLMQTHTRAALETMDKCKQLESWLRCGLNGGNYLDGHSFKSVDKFADAHAAIVRAGIDKLPKVPGVDYEGEEE